MRHTGYITRYIKIHQDTCILDSSSKYIKIQQDTESRYMYLGCVMMTLQDTFEIHHDTCILDASSEPRWIHTRYVRDAMQIRSGYVSWARSICPAAQGAEGEEPAPAPASKKQKKGKGAVAAAPAPAKAAQEPKKPKRKEPKEPKRTSNRRNA